MVSNPTAIRFSDIGERLRAFRMGRSLTPEALAQKLGISRAALYRAEKGQIPKIETLTRIADVLGVSLPNLLGVGVEYVDTAVAFFERMRQCEEQCQQIVVLFGPVSYLLTSDQYDRMLHEVLLESVPDEPERAPEAMQAIETLMGILAARKALYLRKRPLIVSLIASADLERFLLHGLIGRHDLPADVVHERRLQARQEAEHILELIRKEPEGVRIGIVRETIPATSFQIFRQADRSLLAISPFRLGEQPNVRVGVALITSAHEAMVLHDSIATRLWDRSLKGADAAAYLAGLIDRYGLKDDAPAA
ncbi:MAG TPA: helix-turn-helix transcriptional regulator [Alphaproteobacteria bacterium]|nr:helix-turn-helix transcriptional regulator [Alphaproteobacteria bacterium]